MVTSQAVSTEHFPPTQPVTTKGCAMRLYPYTAWCLRQSYEIQHVTLVGAQPERAEADVSEDGAVYLLDHLYLTKSAAIASGTAHIAEMQASVERLKDSIRRRKKALAKAMEENAVK